MLTESGTSLGYHDRYGVDGDKHRIVLAALVTPADVLDNVPLRDLLWRVCFQRKLRPRQVWLMRLDCADRSGWPPQWITPGWLQSMVRPIQTWVEVYPVLAG